jgi:hypothetical protein
VTLEKALTQNGRGIRAIRPTVVTGRATAHDYEMRIHRVAFLRPTAMALLLQQRGLIWAIPPSAVREQTTRQDHLVGFLRGAPAALLAPRRLLLLAIPPSVVKEQITVQNNLMPIRPAGFLRGKPTREFLTRRVVQRRVGRAQITSQNRPIRIFLRGAPRESPTQRVARESSTRRIPALLCSGQAQVSSPRSRPPNPPRRLPLAPTTP